MTKTKIEWTDYTSNPIAQEGSNASYCVKISPGCKNCYAESMSKRLAGMEHHPERFEPYKLVANPPKMELRPAVLSKWRETKKPAKVFVGSMTDIFGDWVPDEWLVQIFDAMIASPKLTFQVLTKRAGRMASFVVDYLNDEGLTTLPSNIWLGVSAESQHYYNERVAHLTHIPCAVRFVSCEPLLGEIDILRSTMAGRIHWIIAGGESGAGARPTDPSWIVKLRDRCIEANVAFFFKQWGEWGPGVDEKGMEKIGKSKAGNMLEGQVWEEFPITSE